MAADETAPPFPVEEPPVVAPTNQTTTSTQIETIETGPPDPSVRRPGELFGMSGRFWISAIAVIGATAIAIIAICRDNLDPQMLGMILGGFIALAGNISSMYLGQNTGPTKSKPS